MSSAIATDDSAPKRQRSDSSSSSSLNSSSVLSLDLLHSTSPLVVSRLVGTDLFAARKLVSYATALLAAAHVQVKVAMRSATRCSRCKGVTKGAAQAEASDDIEEVDASGQVVKPREIGELAFCESCNVALCTKCVDDGELSCVGCEMTTCDKCAIVCEGDECGGAMSCESCICILEDSCGGKSVCGDCMESWDCHDCNYCDGKGQWEQR